MKNDNSASLMKDHVTLTFAPLNNFLFSRNFSLIKKHSMRTHIYIELSWGAADVAGGRQGFGHMI